MLIQDATNAIRLGEFFLKENERAKIGLQYDPDIDSNLLNQQHTMIYLFVVNDVIYKIGQTDTEKGMKSAMNFYTGSMSGRPGMPRFIIHLLIAMELQQKNKVELYGLFETTKTEAQLPGLKSSNNLVSTVTASKYLEKLALKELLDTDNGQYPRWNFQESNTTYPEDLTHLYNGYLSTPSRQREQFARNINIENLTHNKN